jgi:hypothetical protein
MRTPRCPQKSVNEHVAKVEANQSDAAAVSALLEAARDPVSQALDKEVCDVTSSLEAAP